MDALLHDLDGVVGVRGACVFNTEGRILASTLPPGVSTESLQSVGRTFTRTFEALKVARRRKVNDVDLLYEGGRLVVKNLTDGCLIIQCVPTINVPLLNLTANVVARKLHEAMKGQGPEPLSASAVAGVTAPAAETAVPPPAMAAVPVAPPQAVPAPTEPSMAAITPAGKVALDLVEKAREAKTIARVMGRGAVRLRSPTAAALSLTSDEEGLVELAIRGGQSRQAEDLLASLGYVPDRRFNALFGRDRMRFGHPETRMLVEVFLDALVSYHRLELGPRLHLDEQTLPLADLLLSQLLNVKATEADHLLVCCLFADADLGGPGQPAAIDTTRIIEVCSDDWGWYKSVTMNLDRCVAAASGILKGDYLETALRRMKRLQQMLEEAPKTLRWQVRARVGESRRWYEEAE